MSAAPAEARDILMPAVRRLQEGGVASPALDSRLLLGTALGLDRAVLPHETLAGFDDAAAAMFEAFLCRRGRSSPAARPGEGAGAATGTSQLLSPVDEL